MVKEILKYTVIEDYVIIRIQYILISIHYSLFLAESYHSHTYHNTYKYP